VAAIPTVAQVEMEMGATPVTHGLTDHSFPISPGSYFSFPWCLAFSKPRKKHVEYAF